MKMKFKIVLFIPIVLLSISSPRAIVLESEYKEMRSDFCKKESQKKKETTPLNESIERGQCESFAQSTGRISSQTLTGGATGVLITPSVILTAKHVAKHCTDECTFEWPRDKDSLVESDFKGKNIVMHPQADLALIFLDKPLKNSPEILQIDTKEPGKSFSTIAVSYNWIKDNTTGNVAFEDVVRHIMVTKVKLKKKPIFSKKFNFSQTLSLHKEIGKTCKEKDEKISTPMKIKKLWELYTAPRCQEH